MTKKYSQRFGHTHVNACVQTFDYYFLFFTDGKKNDRKGKLKKYVGIQELVHIVQLVFSITTQNFKVKYDRNGI